MILSDLVRYTMDMEQSLQQMTERLLARQTEEMKAGQKEMKAGVNAEAKARCE
jgi:hypothetical protein